MLNCCPIALQYIDSRGLGLDNADEDVSKAVVLVQVKTDGDGPRGGNIPDANMMKLYSPVSYSVH